jgi:hypothetical protein
LRAIRSGVARSHLDDVALASCGYAPSPATGYGDFVVIMTDVDLSSGCDGGTFTGSDRVAQTLPIAGYVARRLGE